MVPRVGQSSRWQVKTRSGWNAFFIGLIFSVYEQSLISTHRRPQNTLCTKAALYQLNMQDKDMQSSVHFLTWGQQRFNTSSVHFSTCFIDLRLWRRPWGEALMWHPKGHCCWIDNPWSVVLAEACFSKHESTNETRTIHATDMGPQTM